MNQPIKVALLCGGPSQERGISLNSARSVLDHLQADDINILPIYFDLDKQAYALSPAHLYSNTPSDFDFKIAQIGQPLNRLALTEYLQGMDIVFPAIHGVFGEDGGVQAFLEEIDVPFVGSCSAACRQSFDKHLASHFLQKHGFFTLPSLLLTPHSDNPQKEVSNFFNQHQLTKAIVKPARAGSSVGVYAVTDVQASLEAMHDIFQAKIDERVVVEPFCTGREFTLIIIQNEADEPVALLPTEIGLEQQGHAIFDYRKKYLPTQQVAYYMPPRFEDATIQQIQREGECLFTLFGLRDCARFDGWVLPNGQVWFSDFNLVSGMEQNSFMFLQGAQVGLSHAGMLRLIVRHACQRIGIDLPALPPPTNHQEKTPVQVIFGGDSSERQVSLMSGTNVWLKLLRSQRYAPHPFLLAPDMSVWQLPYFLTLRHTVEEITEACTHAVEQAERLTHYRQAILSKLQPAPHLISQTDFIPRHLTLNQFITEASLVFIAIHGSIGENGDLQEQLTKAGIPFTGSQADAARLCMDKYATAHILEDLPDAGILTAPKQQIRTQTVSEYDTAQFETQWQALQTQFSTPSLIIKPSDDGCSSGVVRLFSAHDWQTYMELLAEGVPRVPAGTFPQQHSIIEMPTSAPTHLLLEEFIETDDVTIAGNQLHWQHQTGWIEITVGVWGKAGQMHAMTPSITVASGNVLSLEEKFQGGTGINITPPPPEFVPASTLAIAQHHMVTVANTLGISGFARIDAFMHITTGDVMVIEANAIPGLTPSTVIYHQALAEAPPLYPTAFLERILDHHNKP